MTLTWKVDNCTLCVYRKYENDTLLFI